MSRLSELDLDTARMLKMRRTEAAGPATPVEPENVTAPVTAPRLTPWEAVGIDEETWKNLEIPEFLRRQNASPTLTAPTIPTSTPSTPSSATAPAASVSAGTTSGEITSAPIATLAATAMPGVTGGFEHFRVDPEEIERKIKTEADRQWREWMPTKTDRVRHRKSWYERRVRKGYYP